MSPNDDLFPWEEPANDDETVQGMEAIAPGTASASRPPAPGAPPAAGRDQRAREDRGDEVAAIRERTVAPREYYSISEVCEIVGLKPHVLRYWETQFGPLNPSKNRSGNRVYQKKEIRLIMLVKHLLYEEKYTVEGARARLEQLRRTGKLRQSSGQALSADTVKLVRRDLQRLLQILTPAGSK
jgi:DNA-binding transcriptional MerR regulator